MNSILNYSYLCKWNFNKKITSNLRSEDTTKFGEHLEAPLLIETTKFNANYQDILGYKIFQVINTCSILSISNRQKDISNTFGQNYIFILKNSQKSVD